MMFLHNTVSEYHFWLLFYPLLLSIFSKNMLMCFLILINGNNQKAFVEIDNIDFPSYIFHRSALSFCFGAAKTSLWLCLDTKQLIIIITLVVGQQQVVCLCVLVLQPIWFVVWVAIKLSRDFPLIYLRTRGVALIIHPQHPIGSQLLCRLAMRTRQLMSTSQETIQQISTMKKEHKVVLLLPMVWYKRHHLFQIEGRAPLLKETYSLTML